MGITPIFIATVKQPSSTLSVYQKGGHRPKNDKKENCYEESVAVVGRVSTVEMRLRKRAQEVSRSESVGCVYKSEKEERAN